MAFFKPFRFIAGNRETLLYGVALAVLLFVLKWLELRLVIVNHAFEIYIGAIAVLFTGLGIWLALQLARPRVQTVVVEKEVYVGEPNEFVFNETEFRRLGLSRRELDVLLGMAEGLSNHEIGERLFVSVNTVKTHSSNLFSKLDVRSRTQAIDRAKRLRLIP
ncbi:helix-turn-helix transcriptional regulator [Larkinella soli]|uniref:helix-turn-helix transcriptional regulator n=1 Tax=Larkinella soli TaxID=1770527 RepID=UPI000FFC976A|nr:response regulator transcription factor [Larkinella soli]